ncbi:hypothetical protein F2Q68_00004088 [Brassica cretica]|uniref:Uncharacterized protein n=1 Tax=Brassica cretica TaxID=69181 RepID=A0A8S9JM97_BRACR|nr:hypothetical protein F2Q68_00004088 [Brassica cretica]
MNRLCDLKQLIGASKKTKTYGARRILKRRMCTTSEYIDWCCSDSGGFRDCTPNLTRWNLLRTKHSQKSCIVCDELVLPEPSCHQGAMRFQWYRH